MRRGAALACFAISIWFGESLAETGQSVIKDGYAGEVSAIAEAFLDIGDLYRNGKLDPTTGTRLSSFYRRVADEAVADSLFVVISPSVLAPPDKAYPVSGAAAVDAYSASADLGSDEALVRLGDLFIEGGPVAADPQRALGYYHSAVEAGNAAGKLRLGRMLVTGHGVTQDFERGRGLLRDAARANPSAWLVLGEAYASGEAGAIDPSAAIAAFERAAADGDPEGWLRLGDLYREGLIVPADGAKAAFYYRKVSGMPRGPQSGEASRRSDDHDAVLQRVRPEEGGMK